MPIRAATKNERDRCIAIVESQMPFVKDNPVMLSLLIRIVNMILSEEVEPNPPGDHGS